MSGQQRNNSRSKKGSVSAGNEEFKCGQCKETVQEDQTAILCEVCEQWFHSECQGVNKTKYEFLVKQSSQKTTIYTGTAIRAI